MFEKIWTGILFTVVLTFMLAFPAFLIWAAWSGVSWLIHHDVVCAEYKTAKTVTAQTNFWGTRFFVVADDNSSNMQNEAPKIGSKYCFDTKIIER